MAADPFQIIGVEDAPPNIQHQLPPLPPMPQQYDIMGEEAAPSFIQKQIDAMSAPRPQPTQPNLQMPQLQQPAGVPGMELLGGQPPSGPAPPMIVPQGPPPSVPQAMPMQPTGDAMHATMRPQQSAPWQSRFARDRSAARTV